HDAYGIGIRRVRQSLDRLQSLVDRQQARLKENLDLRTIDDQGTSLEALRKSHDGLKALSEQYIEESNRRLKVVNAAIDERLTDLSNENNHLKRTAAERELRFRRIFQVTTVGMSLTTLDWQILDANDAFLNLLGYTRDELVEGRIGWHDLTPPDFR